MLDRVVVLVAGMKISEAAWETVVAWVTSELVDAVAWSRPAPDAADRPSPRRQELAVRCDASSGRTGQGGVSDLKNAVTKAAFFGGSWDSTSS